MSALRIGTRSSALALWQARRVQQLLANADIPSELVEISTLGDRGTTTSPTTDAIKGLFTKEIEHALLFGKVDLAVHSLKDLWVELPAGLVLAAVPERADPRDALYARGGRGLDALASGARVGTSSLRRAAALRHARPDLQVLPLRGNVPTRMRRVDAGELDGAVLAMAGLERLGTAREAVPLDPERFVPAPGQGALAVEARAEDRDVLQMIATLDDPEARWGITAERTAIAALGGGCNVPIGALAAAADDGRRLHVAVYREDGGAPLMVRVEVDPTRPEAAGHAAAAKLVRLGVRAVLESWNTDD